MKAAGKTFVVTGSGSGIGRELTLQLLQHGAKVFGIDLNESALSETVAMAAVPPDRLVTQQLNVMDLDSVKRLPEAVTGKLGSVDAIINNAGIIQPFVRFASLTIQDIDRVIGVNLLGTIYMCKVFLPYLLARPEGYVVNIASMGAIAPVPGQTVYGATKAAVKLLTEGLSSELLGTDVGISVAIPGAVSTNIRHNSGLGTPTPDKLAKHGPRPVSAGQAAQLIIRGIEGNQRRILIGSDAKLVDALYRISPGFAARSIAKKMQGLLGSS